MFTYSKVWQLRHHGLVFQVSPPAELREHYKKLFLVLDMTQQGFGVQLLVEKPAALLPSHAFIGLIRKYCPSGRFALIAENASGHIRLHIMAKSEGYYLNLVKDTPPYCELVVEKDNLSLIRFGQKGTFTKRVVAQELDDSWQNITASLIAHLRGQDFEVKDRKIVTEESLSDVPPEQRELAHRLRRKMKTIAKSLAKHQQGLPTLSELKYLENAAVFLKQYSYMVKEEDIALTLPYEYTNLEETLHIELNPEWNVGRNIEEFYKMLKKRKRAKELGEERQEMLNKEVKDLECDIQRLRSEKLPVLELSRMAQRYKIPLSQSHEPSRGVIRERSPYKEYMTPSGWRLLVGKSPRDNDELTKKAKGHDTWVHSISTPGAHVIIPKQNQPASSSTPDVIRIAGILSLHNSKLRQDMAGEVYVTAKDNLKKKKGLPPGLWLVERSETLFVRYSEPELKAILNMQR